MSARVMLCVSFLYELNRVFIPVNKNRSFCAKPCVDFSQKHGSNMIFEF